jgi:error-prone DNA polymerase
VARSGAAHVAGPIERFEAQSPFDYAACSEVLIVTDIKAGDIAALAGAYARLIEAARGGTLGLFTAAHTRDEGAEPQQAQLPAMPLSEHVVSDYQTLRLSLKAHPMRFLREHYAARKFVTADRLKAIKDGKRLSLAGLVLIRQRPGSAKGVVFITIEDETGVANLVVWPDVFEKQRKIVMGARLMAVHGLIQRDEDSGVIHVVARQVEDHSHMLRQLSDENLPSTRNPGDAAGSWRAPAARHPRDVEIIPKSRDFH